MTPSATKLPRGFRYIALVIGLLALANLACFTIQYTIVYDQSGDGSGQVLLEMTMPRDTGNDSLSFEDASAVKEGLEEQKWVDVQVVELDSAHYLATARYPFGADSGGSKLEDVLPGYTLVIEEAENGYKYYTFSGQANFAEFENFWKTVENDYAVNGISTTTDAFGLGVTETKIEVSAAEVQQWIRTYGPPSATVRVILPGQTPVEANSFWDNGTEFIEGKTDMVTFTWKPGSRAKADLKVIRRLEPLTTVTAEEAQANLSALINQYMQVIPSGKSPIFKWWSGPLAGHLNNNLAAYFNGDNYICSDYQRRIMHWLDQVRASPNEEVRNLLKGLDYGPIETHGGGHRAVVVFPRGTDWRSTGTVFDPWPFQEPRAFPMANWNQFLWGVSDAAKWPYPDSDSGKYYPHLTGGQSSYPASAEIQGDLGRGLAKPVRIIAVRSPVTVLLTFADGRRIGTLPDGTLINELGSGANFYSLPKDDGSGEYETYMFLPEGEFTVALNGIGSGEFHALVATANGIEAFGPQPIAAGQTATFATNTTGQAQPLTLPDGSSVQPLRLSYDQPEQVDAAMGVLADSATVPDSQSPETNDSVGQGDGLPQASNLPGGLDSQTLIAGGLVLFGLLGLLAAGVGGAFVVGWWVKGRRQSPSPVVPPPAAIAQSSTKGSQARLLIEGPDGKRELPLSQASLKLGRTNDNGLPLPSPSVSRQHAEIHFEKGHYTIADLGSINGIVVNGRKISKPVQLKSGDVIFIDPYTIRFKTG